MAFFSHRKHAEEGVVALFDIGNGSVAGSLVSYAKNQRPLIFYSQRQSISFERIPDASQLTKSMLATFLNVAMDIQENGISLLQKTTTDRSVDDVVCTFSSPWSLVEARHIALSGKAEEFEITDKVIENTLKDEEEKLLKEFVKTELADISSTPRVIESNVWQGTVSGYSTPHPKNKKGEDVSLDLFLSVMPEGVYDETEKIIRTLTGKTTFHPQTFSFVALSALRGMYPQFENFILVTITAEITEINFLQRGALTHSGSFPKGKYFILRELAKNLKTVPEEVPTLIKTYCSQTDSQEQRTRMETVLKPLEESWLNSFTEVIERVAPQAILPNTLFFTVDDDYRQLFNTFFQNKNFGEFIFSEKSFNLKPVDEKLLSAFVSRTESQDVFDPFIALEAIYFSQEAHPD